MYQKEDLIILNIMTNNLNWMPFSIEDHKDLGLIGCSSNLGISQQTLSRWKKELKDSGDLECRGSGNYASDKDKEIARLQHELAMQQMH